MINNSMSKEETSFGWLKLARAILFLSGDKKKAYLFWMGLLVLTQLYVVVPGFLIGKIVDFLTVYRSGESLQLFYTYLAILTLGTAIVSLSRVGIKKKLANLRIDISYQARVMGFEKLMDYSLSWHDGEVTGSKFQRIQNGIDQIYVLSGVLVNNIYPTFAMFVGIITVFVFLHPPYILFFIAYSIMFFQSLSFFTFGLIALRTK